MHYGDVVFRTLSDLNLAPIFWFLAISAIVALSVYCLISTIEDGNRLGKESQILHSKLAASLEETRKLAREKLISVDRQYAAKVEALLDEAAEHLNPPIGDSHIYIDIYLLNWHRQGLALIDEAKKLIQAIHRPHC